MKLLTNEEERKLMLEAVRLFKTNPEDLKFKKIVNLLVGCYILEAMDECDIDGLMK